MRGRRRRCGNAACVYPPHSSSLPLPLLLLLLSELNWSETSHIHQQVGAASTAAKNLWGRTGGVKYDVWETSFLSHRKQTCFLPDKHHQICAFIMSASCSKNILPCLLNYSSHIYAPVMRSCSLSCPNLIFFLSNLSDLKRAKATFSLSDHQLPDLEALYGKLVGNHVAPRHFRAPSSKLWVRQQAQQQQ